VQSPHYALKAPYPAPLLGRKTNILAEDMVQAPLTDTKLACRFSNAERSKQAQRRANMASLFPRRSLLT